MSNNQAQAIIDYLRQKHDGTEWLNPGRSDL